MSEADHPDAFTRLNEMELLQDYVHCKLKTTHACSIAGRTQVYAHSTCLNISPKFNWSNLKESGIKLLTLFCTPKINTYR